MSNFAFNDKTFIFELQVKQPSSLLTQYPNATVLEDGRIILPVRDYQIKSQIQRLQRLGAKILDIYSINDLKYQKLMTSSEVISDLTENEVENQPTVENFLTEKSLSSESIISSSAIDPNIPWWVEIFTEFPRCLYYFGPFDNENEAYEYQSGYQEDLEQEGAKGIVVTIKQCSPQILTQEL